MENRRMLIPFSQHLHCSGWYCLCVITIWDMNQAVSLYIYIYIHFRFRSVAYLFSHFGQCSMHCLKMVWCYFTVYIYTDIFNLSTINKWIIVIMCSTAVYLRQYCGILLITNLSWLGIELTFSLHVSCHLITQVLPAQETN